MNSKFFVISVEFCHVLKFEYIIIWYHAVDLLKWDLKDVIIFCPGSRSVGYDKAPSGSLLTKGSFLAVVIPLSPRSRKSQAMAVSQRLTEPPGPLMAHFPRCQSPQNPFLLRPFPLTVASYCARALS